MAAPCFLKGGFFMGMNSQPSGERVHIGFFGMRNAGKSSVVNAVTGQSLSIVSETMGTTTDPVQKAMELLPIGPVVIIDTPGLDDEGALGSMRVERAYNILRKTDIAVLIIDASIGARTQDRELISLFKERSLPYIVVYNKSDICEEKSHGGEFENELFVSAQTGENIYELKEKIAALAKPEHKKEKRIIADLISPGDVVVLVVPIDSAAPKGRLILPQQQTIRDILDTGAMAIVTRESELADTLKSLSSKPRIVVTDSQAFEYVNSIVPQDVPLTSFSILFSRYKGDIVSQVAGARRLDTLKDGDTVLVSEGCTHHRQCDDIGTIKLPGWLKKYTGKTLNYEFTSGGEFPGELERYAVIIHCGGCMLNEKEMQYRLDRAAAQNVPMTNYGVAIAQMHGILKRAVAPLGL